MVPRTLYKILKYYIEELFSGRLLQSANKSKFDGEFGTDTDGIRPIGSLDIALSENSLYAFSYEASPYHVVTEIFKKLSNIAHTRFSFIDFGAGKGRVLFIASLLPFKAVIGIELSPELCEIAKSNIAKIPPFRMCSSIDRMRTS